MNVPIDYGDEEECKKTHPLLLPKIEANTKGEEPKNNPVGDNMKRKNKALGKTQSVDGNVLHKAAYKSCPNRSRHHWYNRGVC